MFRHTSGAAGNGGDDGGASSEYEKPPQPLHKARRIFRL